MSKGQKGNREAKKPKQAHPAAKPVLPVDGLPAPAPVRPLKK